MYSQKKIQFTTPFGYIFKKKSFADYEYDGFQFSKHDEYAQRLCISKFQFYCLKKTCKNIIYLPRTKPTLTNSKQNNLWGN